MATTSPEIVPVLTHYLPPWQELSFDSQVCLFKRFCAMATSFWFTARGIAMFSISEQLNVLAKAMKQPFTGSLFTKPVPVKHIQPQMWLQNGLHPKPCLKCLRVSSDWTASTHSPLLPSCSPIFHKNFSSLIFDGKPEASPCHPLNLVRVSSKPLISTHTFQKII